MTVRMMIMRKHILSQVVGQAAIQAEEEPAVVTRDNLLFIGFIGTTFWTLIFTVFGNPMLNLFWIPLEISLSYLTWIFSINVYLAILWYVLYKHANDIVYQFISACYVFAIVEMFVVWDRPWFRLFGVPMTSNTLIIFGFFFRYADKKWKLLSSFNSTS